MAVLVLAEHDNAVLKDPTLSAIAAAAQVGDAETHVLTAGFGCRAVAEAAAAIAGVSKVLAADAAQYQHGLAEPLADLLASLADGYGHVFAAATTFGKNVLPRLAALKDVAMLSDVSAVVNADTFVRPIYAGNAMATVRTTDALKLVTVRAAAFDAPPAQGGSAAIEDIAPAADSGLSRFVGEELSASPRPELGSARVIVSGGRGMGSGQNFALIEKVADKLGAAVGASRAAVDAGYAPNDHQVGQTGKIVAPDLYIAVGISGAIQHLAGMKDSKVIVAINKDAEAPIFQVADYGLVADLFEALPELEAAL
nr:FAD-binding protein [uncultured Brevundimonas sp.]